MAWNRVRRLSEPSVRIHVDAAAGTSEVTVIPCTLPNGTKLFLVDTPGFDDTYKTDTEILREVAGWLTVAYQSKIELTGIIYLRHGESPHVQETLRRQWLG